MIIRTVRARCKCSHSETFWSEVEGPVEQSDRIRAAAVEGLARHAELAHPGQSRLRRWWRQR